MSGGLCEYNLVIKCRDDRWGRIKDNPGVLDMGKCVDAGAH